VSPSVEIRWARPVRSAALDALLDPVEHRQLARLAGEADRRRFVAAHALLRLVLSQATGVPAADLAFSAAWPACGAPHGRRAPIGRPDQHVSLAHAGDRVVVARTTAGPVGVDVEPIAPVDADSFDRVALAESERVALGRIDPDQRDLARLRLWVGKESLLKATGHGLRVSPAAVVVTPPPDPPQLLAWTAAEPAPGPTFLAAVDVGLGHIAGVAVLTNEPLEVGVADATARLLAAT
jgi:4'-phosphopantetheinyl transferase